MPLPQALSKDTIVLTTINVTTLNLGAILGALSGKATIVTGAGQGIGRAIALRYAEEGARVALVDLDGGTAAKVADELGRGAIAVTANVGDEGSVAGAVETVLAAFGTIDVLVNNAAAESLRAPVTELPLADWEHVLRTNLTGVFLMCRAALPTMLAAGSGAIVNVASQLGSVANRENAAYCASKGGVLQLTRAMALDCAPKGVRVNALSPGAVMTPRLGGLFGSDAAANEQLAPLHPLGRIGRPEEMAGAAVYLASDEAGFVTGADFVVDGGYTAQ